MLKKITEEEIIAGLKNNDNRVFNELYDLFSASLHYFSKKLTQDHEESKDIVISTFGTLWNLRNNFESLANIRAFLFITVKNRCFNFLEYRQRQAEGRKELSSHLTSLDNEADVERLIVKTDFLAKVHDEIQHLPPQCKEVFILTYFYGLTSGQIATQLGITVSTVTTQRSRAIKFLKNVLKNERQFLSLFLVGYSITRRLTDCLP